MDLKYVVRWDNRFDCLSASLKGLKLDDEMTDVSLYAEGQRLKSHQVILAALSPYLRETFKENPCKHPIIIFKGVAVADLRSLMELVYKGQVTVDQDEKDSFLATADALDFKGIEASVLAAAPAAAAAVTANEETNDQAQDSVTLKIVQWLEKGNNYEIGWTVPAGFVMRYKGSFYARYYNKDSQQKSFWRCMNHRGNCEGRLTKIGSRIYVSRNHSHAQSPVAVIVKH